MTEFSRKGHWRTSKYGMRYWVSGHTVERYDWDRVTFGWSDYTRSRLNELEAAESFTARFINPNAICPDCGELVFFYQNEYGSRVFFDELGPPWPKHPCTDNSAYRKRRFTRARKPKGPAIRESNSIAEIQELQADAGIDPFEEFQDRFGRFPWSAWIVRRKFRLDDCMLLIASPLDVSKTRLLYLMLESFPRNMADGDIFFYKRGHLEFLSPKSLKPVSIAVEKLSGSSKFISKLIDPGRDSHYWPSPPQIRT